MSKTPRYREKHYENHGECSIGLLLIHTQFGSEYAYIEQPSFDDKIAGQERKGVKCIRFQAIGYGQVGYLDVVGSLKIFLLTSLIQIHCQINKITQSSGKCSTDKTKAKPENKNTAKQKMCTGSGNLRNQNYLWFASLNEESPLKIIDAGK